MKVVHSDSSLFIFGRFFFFFNRSLQKKDKNQQKVFFFLLEMKNIAIKGILLYISQLIICQKSRIYWYIGHESTTGNHNSDYIFP